MRMWMTDPRRMCRQHLLGEHRELHTFLSHLKRERSIGGYIEHNCLEPLSLGRRHQALVEEMELRGWDHKSPLDFSKGLLRYLPKEHREYRVDREKSTQRLFQRCSACRRENEHRELRRK